MQAYVQISLDTAREKEVLERLNAMEEVLDVHILFGEWDMIAKIEVKNADDLGNFVIQNIRTLPGVKVTSTNIIAR